MPPLQYESLMEHPFRTFQGKQNGQAEMRPAEAYRKQRDCLLPHARVIKLCSQAKQQGTQQPRLHVRLGLVRAVRQRGVELQLRVAGQELGGDVGAHEGGPPVCAAWVWHVELQVPEDVNEVAAGDQPGRVLGRLPLCQ